MKITHRTFTLLAATLFITACEQSTSPDKAIINPSTSSSTSTSSSSSSSTSTTSAGTTTTSTAPTTVTPTTLAPTTTLEKPADDKPAAAATPPASGATAGAQSSEKPTAEKPATDTPSASGEALAQQSGCFACHAIDRKLVGPAWRDVAKHYRGAADARDRLIVKVRTGGAGNWTEITGGVAMPPYSPRVSDSDIASLIDFILALPEQPN